MTDTPPESTPAVDASTELQQVLTDAGAAATTSEPEVAPTDPTSADGVASGETSDASTGAPETTESSADVSTEAAPATDQTTAETPAEAATAPENPSLGAGSSSSAPVADTSSQSTSSSQAEAEVISIPMPDKLVLQCLENGLASDHPTFEIDVYQTEPAKCPECGSLSVIPVS